MRSALDASDSGVIFRVRARKDEGLSVGVKVRVRDPTVKPVTVATEAEARHFIAAICWFFKPPFRFGKNVG